jgi:hypothetical protein
MITDDHRNRGYNTTRHMCGGTRGRPAGRGGRTWRWPQAVEQRHSAILRQRKPGGVSRGGSNPPLTLPKDFLISKGTPAYATNIRLRRDRSGRRAQRAGVRRLSAARRAAHAGAGEAADRRRRRGDRGGDSGLQDRPRLVRPHHDPSHAGDPRPGARTPRPRILRHGPLCLLPARGRQRRHRAVPRCRPHLRVDRHRGAARCRALPALRGRMAAAQRGDLRDVSQPAEHHRPGGAHGARADAQRRPRRHDGNRAQAAYLVRPVDQRDLRERADAGVYGLARRAIRPTAGRDRVG